jgi:hypothetical protein
MFALSRLSSSYVAFIASLLDRKLRAAAHSTVPIDLRERLRRLHSRQREVNVRCLRTARIIRTTGLFSLLGGSDKLARSEHLKK